MSDFWRKAGVFTGRLAFAEIVMAVVDLCAPLGALATSGPVLGLVELLPTVALATSLGYLSRRKMPLHFGEWASRASIPLGLLTYGQAYNARASGVLSLMVIVAGLIGLWAYSRGETK